MIRLLFAFLLFAAVTPAQIDSAWVAQNYVKQEVMVPMRDGVHLFTTIYSPRSASEKHPILMMRTPYSVAPYGSGIFSQRLYRTYWAEYLQQGYIIVMQDVRGRYMSEGMFVDVRPYISAKKGNQTDEASDAYDTIEWLLKHAEGNNGNVGVFGISYPGFYATMAAVGGHPALKAVSPQAPVTDWFMGDDFHHNGAFALMDAFGFYYSFGSPRSKPDTRHGRSFNFHSSDAYQFYLKQGSLSNISKYMDSVPFWNELMHHPDYDAWWKARDARRACYNLKPNMLVVGGTFDAEDCFGAWNLYRAIETQSPATSNRLVMGPWFHGAWGGRGDGSSLGNIRFGSKTALYYQQRIEVHFFNHFLKGAPADSIAEATVFFSGANEWRKFSSWPPPIKETPVFFDAYGHLSFQKPAAATSASYTSDPAKPVPYAEGTRIGRTREYMDDDQRFAARRPDVLVYETDYLDRDLTLAGPLTADLVVNITGTDADFVVKVIDVFPDEFGYDTAYCCAGTSTATMAGYQMLVRGEIMRGKFRKAFDKPVPFSPGANETVSFTLPDIAHTFKTGHKLMIQVQSSWFPLFDRNPQVFTNIYECANDAFRPIGIKLLHGGDHPSQVILPVVSTP